MGEEAGARNSKPLGKGNLDFYDSLAVTLKEKRPRSDIQFLRGSVFSTTCVAEVFAQLHLMPGVHTHH